MLRYWIDTVRNIRYVKVYYFPSVQPIIYVNHLMRMEK